MESNGWGIVIIASAFMIQVIVFGISTSIGVYNIEFLDYFNNDTVGISLIAAVNWAVFLGSGPLASYLMTKMSFRKITLLGSVLVVLGVLLMPFLPYIPALIVCFGLLAGLGSCLVYVPSHVLSGLYFEKNQSLATGLATSGSGLGGAVMPIVVGKLIEHYGWRGSLIIVAGMELHLIAFSALLRSPPKILQKERGDEALILMEQNVARNELTSPLECVKEHTLQGQISGKNLVACENDETACEPQVLAVDKSETIAPTEQFEKIGDDLPNKMSSTVSAKALTPDSDLQQLETVVPDTWCSDTKPDPTRAETAALIAFNDDINCTEQTDTTQAHSVVKNSNDISLHTEKHVKVLRHIYLFTDMHFTVYFISNILWNSTASTALAFVPEFVAESGISVLNSAWLMTIFGLGDFVGGILGGVIGNIWPHRRFSQYVIANMAFGTCMAACPFGSTFTEFAVILMTCGIAFGTVLGLLVVVLTDLIGSKNLGDGLGYIMLANGIGAFSGPSLTGYIRSVTGSYKLAFYIAGVLGLLAGASMWLISIIEYFCPKTEKPRSECEIEIEP